MDHERLSPLAVSVLARITAMERRKRLLRRVAILSLLSGGLLLPLLRREEPAPGRPPHPVERPVDPSSVARAGPETPPPGGPAEDESDVPDAAVLDAYAEGGGAAALLALERLIEEDRLEQTLEGLAVEGLERFVGRSPARQKAALLERVAAAPPETRARLAGLVLAGLDDDDATVRSVAIRALGTCFPEDRSHPVLESVLLDRAAQGQAEERRAVAVLLAEPRFRHLSFLLVRGLDDSAASVRATAAFALGSQGVREAADDLRPLLGDEEQNVRVAAARSLGLLGDPAGIEFLKETLDHPDATWRAAALGYLHDAGDPAALDAARRFLETGDPTLRYEALRILAEARQPVERRHLDAALESGDPSLREVAGRALLSQGLEEGVEVLRALLTDDASLVGAAHALLEHDAARFSPEIRARLDRTNAPQRRQLEDLLRRFEPP